MAPKMLQLNGVSPRWNFHVLLADGAISDCGIQFVDLNIETGFHTYSGMDMQSTLLLFLANII